MYTLFNSLSLTGQDTIKTWEQQGRSWASYSVYRDQATHELYIPQTILNLVVQGEKRMYDGRQVHYLHAGDAMIIPSGSLLCSEILRPQRQYGSINLVIPDEMILAFLKKPGKTNTAGRALTTLPVNSRWHSFTQSLLRHFADDNLTTPDYYDIISHALHLISGEEAISAMLTKAAMYPLPEVMEKLSTGMAEVKQLEEVAAMGHMSTATLKRRFRDIYHSSPMHWVLEKRLQMAGFLLRTTEQPIAEIAYSTGFEDVTHFYRQFRRCFEVTPLQWRKMETDLFSK
ncbi:helix-turn-helix transcriptional regulator [Chitinophaga ginsengisegetis]|uniref:helix-turn-helix transcriptional regulator n=1 Tax=Chitinophaga ginsengisegetis TaxID=393003 RepID=UPI000DB947DC|nr:AraC family transcriptional regulator [Chitinophaga ginsengisegetis]MDR6565706.1 AraC-like DNA-binding protein [Chitinophaga ginsengisegetis]MDR6645435.1 AraC-like DNA-binding protein [Chitinophaga ginsengisegetis]MDR6651973.1 AraC-like DNA-binding protein [Chitinophaga ginsengisegetis]